MQKTRKPKIQGIDAVMIYAADPASLSEWYATHLGIQTTREEDGNFYGDVVDEQAGKTVHVGIYAAETPKHGTGAAGDDDPRPVMVNYRVDDLTAFLDGLRQQGVAIEKTVDEGFGRFAYFRDAEGNRIEVWSPGK